MLEYHERSGASGAPWVVLLHGFGANGRDLAGLVPMLDPAGRLNWLFPEAPVVLGQGLAGPSRAWFPRTQDGLTAVMNGEYFANLADLSPPGLTAASAELRELLEHKGIPVELTVIGGFSQGSMVALRASLGADTPPRGVILFSSALVSSEQTRSLAHASPGLPFVQSHGTRDPILSFESGRALFSLLDTAGLEGRFVSFPGAHEIPSVAVEAARSLLASVTKQ